MAFEEQEFEKMRRELAEVKAELSRMKEFTSSVEEVERLRYITKGLKGTNTFYVATSSGGAVTNAITVKNGIITNG